MSSSNLSFRKNKIISSRSKSSNDKMIARARALQSTSSDIASDPHSDSVNISLDNGQSLVIPVPDENDTVVREARIPKRKLLKNPGEESTPPEALPSENLVGINIH